MHIQFYSESLICRNYVDIQYLRFDRSAESKQVLKKQCVRRPIELIWLRTRLWAFGQHEMSFQIP